MAHRLVATISGAAAAKLEVLRLALGEGREADAVEFALRTADPAACRAAYLASLLGRREAASRCAACELVERLAGVLSAGCGGRPTADVLAPVVLALAARLVARRGSSERLPLVLVHTLIRALLELHRSGRAEKQEDG